MDSTKLQDGIRGSQGTGAKVDVEIYRADVYKYFEQRFLRSLVEKYFVLERTGRQQKTELTRKIKKAVSRQSVNCRLHQTN